jgi:hypothetical protein
MKIVNNQFRKLQLNAENIRVLSNKDLRHAQGGDFTPQSNSGCTQCRAD